MSNPFLEAYSYFQSFKAYAPQRISPICFPGNYEALFTPVEVDTTSGSLISNSPSPSEKFVEIFGHDLCSDYRALFTDGSVKINGEGAAGFAVALSSGEILFSSATLGFLSSFTVESLAILKALQICDREQWPNAVIFSDSLFNILAISSCFNPSLGSFLILEIRNLLYVFKQRNWKIRLVWIPAHRGIPGNEYADRAAKEASAGPSLGSSEVPARELKRYWREYTTRDSMEWAWRERGFRGSKFFKAFFELDNYDVKSPWFDKLSLKRRTISSINRLRSEHSSLRASLFRFLMVDSPDCPYCGEVETPEHVFWSCFKYEEHRLIMLRALTELYGYGPFHLEFLLRIPSSEVAFILEKFICSIPTYI